MSPKPKRLKNTKPTSDSGKSVPPPKEPVMIRVSRWSVGLQVVFFLFAFWFLCILNRDYLFILHEYNLFLNSLTFFWKHCTHVGGLLEYIASFLAQFFLWHCLGGGILVLLLFFIRLQSERLFQLTGSGILLSFVPPFLLIWLFTQPGYAVFADMRTDTLYSVFIGVLLALCFALWYARIVSPVRRSVFCSLGTILLYYLAGIHGLWGALLCLYCECSFPREKRRVIFCLFPILCGILTPFLLFWLQLTKTNLVFAYRIGLPRGINLEHNPILYQFLVLLASLIILACLRLAWNSEFLKRSILATKPKSKIKHSEETEKQSLRLCVSVYDNENGIPLRFAVLSVLLLVLMCCATYVFSHTRGDFLITAKMCRLVCEENWDGILKIHDENEKPTYPIMLFRQLALFKLDRIADEVFTWPTTMLIDEKQLKWTRSSCVFGDHILFEYGLINMAFRTAMVQNTMKESTISNLRILALSAIAKEEYEVAKKYLRLIKQSPFYRDWAQNHLEYVESCKSSDPMEILAMSQAIKEIDLGLSKIRKLMPVDNEIENNERIDALILRGFTREKTEEATHEVRKMFLVQLLMFKDLVTFHKYYDLWADELYPDRIPRHFQEALIMDVTSKEVNAHAAHYGISPDLGRKFAAFMNRLDTTMRPGDPVDPGSLIYQEFGDTFWFYFFLK